MTCVLCFATLAVCCLIIAVSAAILGGRRDQDIPPLTPPADEEPDPEEPRCYCLATSCLAVSSPLSACC